MTNSASFLHAMAIVATLTASPWLAAQDQRPIQPVRTPQRSLGLVRSHVVEVPIQGQPGKPLLASIGLNIVLQLEPHSVRARGFRVLEQDQDGRWRQAATPPLRTYRGKVLGMPGSVVAASLLENGLHAQVRLVTGDAYWVEPVPGRAGLHAVYRRVDVARHDGTCGADRLANTRPFGRKRSGSSGPSSALKIGELACDADFEYFQDYGTTNNVVARIESVINQVNVQYERDVGIQHTITTILVRTSSSQPYTSTDATSLLYQFRNEWNANQGGVQRDMAQLFTGKDLNGGTIGIAWLGVVCNLSYAYSAVQSDFNNNFGCATDLTAHELGHNWDADHCSCTSNTMNPYITCANVFHPTFSIPEITQFRDSRTCLSDGGGGNPQDVHVESITVTTLKEGRGRNATRKARAVVTIHDDLGQPVAGATVHYTFSGGVGESGTSGATGADGSVTITSTNDISGKGKKSQVTLCVDNVSASLPYDSGDNQETCDSN